MRAHLTLAGPLDRQGRKTSISQGSDTTEFLYTEAGLPVSEKGTAGTLNGLTITNQYDTLMRRSSVKAMITSPATTLSSATYGYDAASRLLGVTNGNYSVNYAYLANSPLVDQLTFRESTTTRMTTTKSYDYLNRLLSISSTAGSSVISSHGYVYNDANQRTRVDLVDGSYWIYEYDKLGQVTAGRRYWADGSVVAGQQFDYAFDDIGNRSSTKIGGDANGLNQRSATYSANNLNQYTSRTVPAQVNVSGIAHPASTVTVNSQSTSRNGEYYWGEATANNTSAADFLSITSLSVFGTTNNSSTGYVFVPKTPEAFSYDADGNLTNDGRWVYTWDAENRLIQLESQTTAPSASKRKITYNYDYQSRLVARKSYTNNGSYQIKSDTKYLNDGWRCLAEVNATNNNVIRGYVWGLDLSGTLEGAGGIGGLLMLTDSATSTSHFYAYDGNGNVSAMAKTSDSSKTAHYEYGPFGEVTRASGTIAKSNPMRFSTKCQDEESDLLYYGYRFYDASLGRWPSRDPIGELATITDPYVILANDALGTVDLLGLLLAPTLEKVIKGKANVSRKNIHETSPFYPKQKGEHSILEYEDKTGCPLRFCAKVEKAKEISIGWETKYADPRVAIGLTVTADGYISSVEHEKRRQAAISLAYAGLLQSIELTGTEVRNCSPLCCATKGTAKKRLQNWLDSAQKGRIKAAIAYINDEQNAIHNENNSQLDIHGVDVNLSGLPFDHFGLIHNSLPPPSSRLPPCPSCK